MRILPSVLSLPASSCYPARPPRLGERRGSERLIRARPEGRSQVHTVARTGGIMHAEVVVATYAQWLREDRPGEAPGDAGVSDR